MNNKINRGDIYYAALDPAIGSEQGGIRPVLIIQNNKGNTHSPTVIVAAITSKAKPKLPTHLSLEGVPNLHPKSIVLLEQVRTIDKCRLQRFVATIDRETMREIGATLARSLDIRRARKGELLMTLCSTCKIQFEDSNFSVELLSAPTDPKETCDYCNCRVGFDYMVEEV